MMSSSRKMALCLAYDGTAYHGWQRQSGHASIQGSVESAISNVANHVVDVQCAGRTDAGVHASKQVIHFETTTERELYQWINAINFYLPKDIRVLYAKHVDDDFHARFSATSRMYHYVIYHQAVASVFLTNRVMFSRHPLDVSTMQAASAVLMGEHDFSAFRGRDCQSKTPIRTIKAISFRQSGDFIYITFIANAFLHHMVRNIVGSLIEVGLKKQSCDWLKEVLLSRDRRCAGPMAPPDGLYLADVNYPVPYLFPPMPFPFQI